jgi:hypothetical protein
VSLLDTASGRPIDLLRLALELEESETGERESDRGRAREGLVDETPMYFLVSLSGVLREFHLY